MRSASKLKRGVIEGTGGLFWFSVIVSFSSSIFFVGSYVPWIVMRTLSVNLFDIFHDIRLSSTLLWTFFSMWSSVFVLCCFSFLLNLMLNMTWITGHIHRSIVDKIDPTSEDVEMIKKIPHQLHWVKYIFLWNVNRTEFICCAFNWSVKNTFYEPWRRPPHPLSSKVEEWLMVTFVMEK